MHIRTVFAMLAIRNGKYEISNFGIFEDNSYIIAKIIHTSLYTRTLSSYVVVLYEATEYVKLAYDESLHFAGKT